MKIELGKYKNKTVFIDLDAAINGNMLSNGLSGTGKTTISEGVMAQICEQGGTVLALDMHRTLADDQIFWKYKAAFKKYAHDVEAYTEGIPCRLLAPMQYSDGSQENPADTASSIANVFGRTLHLGCNQQGMLRVAIEHVITEGSYEKLGFCAIANSLEKMGNSTAKSVKEKLHQMEAHNIFRPGEGFIQARKINIIRLSKFDLQTQEVLAEMLLSYIWRLAVVDKFKKDGIFIFLDEIQNLPSGRHCALAQMLSEGRKFNVNLLLATQQLLGGTSVIQQRLTQCATNLYFQPDANRVSGMANMIDPCQANEWSIILRTEYSRKVGR